MPMISEISLIIPALNERECIGKTLPLAYHALAKRFNEFEVIVVDDGSKDGTGDCIDELAKTLPKVRLIRHPRNRGKGHSIKSGVFAARHPYILFSDADFSTPIDELDKFIEQSNDGSDIIIASRGLADSKVIVRQSPARRIAGKLFNVLVQTFLFKGIRDTQCGFKCFKLDIAKELFSLQRIFGFCFDAELLFIAKKKGYTIKEVPVRWINRTESRVSFLRDSLRILADIFKIRLNDLRACYNEGSSREAMVLPEEAPVSCGFDPYSDITDTDRKDRAYVVTRR
jgi:dolichyl-phosphate beta-glucosyltransferase